MLKLYATRRPNPTTPGLIAHRRQLYCMNPGIEMCPANTFVPGLNMEMNDMPALFETVGQQKRRAAVVVGRFNPPTIGHYKVFDIVKKYIRDHQDLRLDAVPIVVVVAGKETSKDKTKNPLTANERVSFMAASGKANGVKFLVAKSAYDAFEEVRKAGFEPIAVAAGSDRGDKYLEMLDKYFKTPDGKEIDHYSITVDRVTESKEKIDKKAALDDILQYMDDEVPTNMVSASLARRAVELDEFEKFAVIVGLEDKRHLARKMFDKIKAAMSAQEPNDGPA